MWHVLGRKTLRMITVLMGAPGSGKTTWVNSYAMDELILSTEAIRVMRDELDAGAFMNGLRMKGYKAMHQGQSVIVDGTNTITHQRLFWLNAAKKFGLANRLIAFDTPLEVLLHVQKTREHPAPNNIVREHHYRFKKAIIQIRAEKWDQIEVIKR